MNRTIILWVLLVSSAACSRTTEPANGSQTHFLRDCDGECGGGLSCVCGVCTEVCTSDAICEAHAERASCEVPPDTAQACTGVAKVCDLACTSDAACHELGDRFICEAGRCRERGAGIDAGSAGTGSPDGGTSGTGAAGTGGGAAGTGVDAGPEPDAGTDAGTASACALAMDVGPCDAAIPRWFFDTANRACAQFTWGGCEANANNFETRQACEAACDPTALPCSVDATGTSLPGATVHVEGDLCAVPTGRTATFRYTIDLAQPIPYTGVDSGGCGHCGGYSDDPMSLVRVRIAGSDAQYCSCIEGCCAPTAATAHTLAPGRYDGELVWPGREWNGPSDTMNPLGPLFPAGPAEVIATLDVPGVGTIAASLAIQVLPPTFAPGDPSACLVEGDLYASGDGRVPDPRSCNTCTCLDGDVNACTDIACDEPCGTGTLFGTSCAQCGPTDACEVVESGCLPTCTDEADCPGFPSCIDGACRGVCG